MMKLTGLVLAGALLTLASVAFIVEKDTQSKAATSAPQLSEAYINSKFGYELRYPKGEELGYTGLATTSPIRQSAEIIIGSPGIFRVDALDAEPNKPEHLSALQRVETIRQLQLSSENPNLSKRQVGALQETKFAGQPAYSFTLTEAYSTSNGGYLLEPAETVYQLVFLVNNTGVLLMIQYPLGNDAAALIARSFTLTQSQ
jgi:hypothetical protein